LSNFALPGSLIDYNQNPSAYKIYDITNNKVILSRSVVFFEDTPGNCNSPSIPEFINFIPYYEIGGDSNDDDFDFHLNTDNTDNTDNNINNNINNDNNNINNINNDNDTNNYNNNNNNMNANNNND